MKTPRFPLSAIVLLVALAISGTSCKSTGGGASGGAGPGMAGPLPGDAKAGPEPSSKEPPALAVAGGGEDAGAIFDEPLSPECQRMYLKLQGLDAGVPLMFYDLERTVEQINADIVAGIGLARNFLTECPGTPPTCAVRAILARFLMARHARHREDLENARRQELQDAGLDPKQIQEAWPEAAADVDAAMNDYLTEIEGLAASVLSECRSASRARQSALRAIADALERRGNYEEMRRVSKQLLTEYPEYPSAPHIHSAVARTFLTEGRYKEAVEYLKRVITERSGDPEYVLYNDRLFDALTGAGDLEGMEELMHLIRAEYPTRIPELKSDFLRGLYEQWYYNAPFWIAFVRLALGDDEGASSYFRQSADEVTALEAQLAAEGKALNRVVQIFRDFRTQDLIDYLLMYHGKMAPVDFDLSPRPATAKAGNQEKPASLEVRRAHYWATEKKLTLAESKGKVVAAVFRNPGNFRSAAFLQEIDRLVKEREKDGLAGITLGFLTGSPDPKEDERMLQLLRDDLARLKVSLPAGFDPDHERQSIFRSIHATVGTASFIVFNRKGEIAWFLADPRDLDRAVARRVIDRLLAER